MNKHLHFESLDGLRFFAFLKVYLLHLPYVAGIFPTFELLKSGGGIGVSFFFTLSGFLITYLLVNEKISSGTINLKKFFIRRSLRIWPLYFLILGLVYFLPVDFKTLYLGYNSYAEGYPMDWRYSFSFLENYKMIMADSHPSTSTLRMFWSLCIEEHFYIIWVIVLFFIPKKRILLFLFTSIVIAMIARYLEPSITNNLRIESNDVLTNLDFFGCGGLLGYLIAKSYTTTINFINKVTVIGRLVIILLIVLFVVYQKYVYPYEPGTLSHIFRATTIAILFTILIAMFLPKDSKIKIGRKNPLSYLGKISYGLYVYHVFIIHYLNDYFIDHHIALDNWKNIWAFALISFITSVIISSFSYHFFEQPFLKIRERIAT